MRKWRLRARASLFRAAWIFAAVFYSYTCRSRTTDRKRHAQRRIASYFMRGTWGQALYTNTLAGWLVMLPSYQATPAKKGKNGTEEERAAKTGKGGAEKSDRLISLTTRPRKGIYSWRRTQTRAYCLSKLFFRSQWTCRLCEISRGLSLKYSIKRPDEIYTRPASNDRPLESGVSCHVFHIWSKKLEFRSFWLIVRIYHYNTWIDYVWRFVLTMLLFPSFLLLFVNSSNNIQNELKLNCTIFSFIEDFTDAFRRNDAGNRRSVDLRIILQN